MNIASHYWQQVRLRSSGQYWLDSIAPLEAWLTENFSHLLADETNLHQTLQPALWTIYQTQKDEAELAQRSLHCYISHQIQAACFRLVEKFGHDYGFTSRDILPLVLDDENPAPEYQPLSHKILQTYDPTKAKLSTWTAKLVNTHPELNKALLERGLHRATDWGLLNGTTLEQLQRILRDYFMRSDVEIAAASQLLARYRQVYLSDRLAQRRAGRRGRCPAPSEAQLRRIAPQPPEETLVQLKELAELLRDYRTRQRLTNAGKSANVDWEQVADTPSAHGVEETEQSDFLAVYRSALRDCLDDALTAVIQANVDRLQKRRTVKAQGKDHAYVQGLQLFFCEALSMGRLAARIGLASQVQVTRLLQLTRLRADVRHYLIPRLCDRLQTAMPEYLSTEQLERLDHQLADLLTEEVSRIMDEDGSQAHSPHPSERSLFAQQLCEVIHQFL